MRFVIREADFKDRDCLLHLAQCFPLCSLPNNKSKMEKKIQTSKESFKQILLKKKRNYLFILEDRKEKKVIGSSQILSYFGENKSLCYFLKKEEGGSYLKLKPIKTGRHQLGGLILHPDYRSFPENLGLQIGAARFLYMKTFPKEFSPLIEVSLTAPIQRGKNHFWRETGFKYLKMNYYSALKSFQKNRLQFLSFFPNKLKINLDKLSPDAKNYLKQVHPQTLPVYKGLLKRGFHRTKHYHVLDGGMYLEARWKDISFLKESKKRFLKKDPFIKNPSTVLLSQQTKKGFLCTQVTGEAQGKVLLLKHIPPGFEEKKKTWILHCPF